MSEGRLRVNLVKPEIRVFYSCSDCGLCRVGVSVIAREEDEDLLAWMHKIGQELGADHDRRSPGCSPGILGDILIPMHGTNRVGGPSVQ